MLLTDRFTEMLWIKRENINARHNPSELNILQLKSRKGAEEAGAPSRSGLRLKMSNEIGSFEYSDSRSNWIFCRGVSVVGQYMYTVVGLYTARCKLRLKLLTTQLLWTSQRLSRLNSIHTTKNDFPRPDRISAGRHVPGYPHLVTPFFDSVLDDWLH